MSSTMLASPPTGPGRMSQLLPTVKCSNCNQPVPLSDLGEHICAPAPPVPSLPRPSRSSEEAAALLPTRLQGRVGSPSPSPSSPPNSIGSRLASPPPRNQNPPNSPQHQRLGSAVDRLRANTGGPGSANSGYQPRSSPLARPGPQQGNPGSPTLSRGPEPPPSSPFTARPPASADPRMRNTPNSSSMSLNYASRLPPPSRPSVPPGRQTPPPQNGIPPPLDQSRFPPNRSGTPAGPASAPAGLPTGPRGVMNGPNNPLPGYNGLPPPNRNAPSPAPSHMPINRNAPSPAPSMNRNGPPPLGPQPMRNGPGQGQPPGPPQPRVGFPPGGPPGVPPNRTGSPFMGPPPQNRMPPGSGGPPGRPAFNAPPRPPPSSLPPGAPPPVQMMPPQGLPMLPFGQRIPENDIDTKSGGEAGMAGVGRRGFAAAARAAMFAAPPMKPLGPQPQTNRPDAPRFLDMNTASRDTPPLSPTSGYSPHSPGPTSPLAQAHFPSPVRQDTVTEKMARLPTPPAKIDTSVLNPSLSNDKTPVDKTPMPAPNTPASPFGIRLPFFEKLKNMVPASSSPVETTPTTAQPTSNLSRELGNDNPTAAPSAPPAHPSAPTNNSRSLSISISDKTEHDDADKVPISPTTGSEYSGLAYAASTDYEDDARSRGSAHSDRSNNRSEPPPPLPSNAAAIARSVSANPSARIHFSSSPEEQIGIPLGKPAHAGRSRNTSTSSYSSSSSVEHVGRKRTNSSVIAQALGLSQTPPSDYAKLGGPGLPSRSGRPLGRSTSNSSLGSRSAYSRTTSLAPGNGAPSGFEALERTMDSLLKDEGKKGADLVKSKSASAASGKQRTTGGSSVSGSVRGTEYTASEFELYDQGSITGSSSGAKTQRSKTVQGIPELKPPKLPTRSKTTSDDRNSTLDGGRVKKERTKKERICVKCKTHIDDGRWIQVDTGSILCERCWKNMYLPKCRRCNLPIERQAVSSSDGQLKGKYHKECFNCHTCHKPFPDKTFYVFDGKPLCAYHYHEANDSLCAAARCGQPIEGPCAVSHAGDRYHPDCMTCEYPGYPDCRERLSKEYWEVDGRMLCEWHAHMNSNGSDDEDEQWAPSSKAMKRVTRFIDLAGGPGTPNAGGEGDSGLR